MNEQEIINSDLTVTEKARRLYDLGKSRKEVAQLVCKGNYGFAYNIEKAYLQKKEAAKAAAEAQKETGEKPEKKVQPAGREVKEVQPKQPAPGKKAAVRAAQAPVKAQAPAKKKVDPRVIKKSVAGKNKTAAKAKAKKGIRR